MRRSGLAALVAAFCGLVTAACGDANSPTVPQTGASPPAPVARPNLVVIVTDDLDVPTYKEMPRLRDVLARQGLSFTHAYATQPLCAPSRASILTGQYSHSHLVMSNHPPSGGWPAFRRLEQATIATWLKAAGYRTSLVGKYLNDYPKNAAAEYIPPGWDDWYGHLSALEDGRYFNYWVNDNGVVSRLGSKPEDYSVDREAARAVKFVRDSAGRPEPILLYLAPEAPHFPANYPARHDSEYRYALAPRVPSFNESDVSDKPSPIRQIPYLTDAEIEALDRFQVWRLRSLSAVEDLVNAILQALDQTGRLGSTYLFFTSDNGNLMGQHRAVNSKGSAYEESIGIPLVVRGPGVSVGSVAEPVLNVDLPATLLELAGVDIPDSVEGRSFAPFLRGAPPSSWRTEVLIEGYGLGHSYGLRTADWLYNHTDTEELELYDMHADPYQLASLHRRADPALLDSLEQRTKALLACRDISCR